MAHSNFIFRSGLWLALPALLFSACQPVLVGSPANLPATQTAPTVAASPSAPVTAFVGGTLIDGSGAAPLPGAVVLVQAGQILAAGPASAVPVPAGARIIDIRGGTVLPGFINAHVHRAFDSSNLRAWAVGGVTTVRDESTYGCGTLKTTLDRRGRDLNKPEYARIISAGCMIGRPGGYGSLFVSNSAEIQRAVLDELAAGADQIKVSEEDGYAGRSGLPKLSESELDEIIALAHERGVKVSAHITQASYMAMVVEAGVDDVAHMAYDPITDETIAALVAKDIYLTPTFSVLQNYDAIGSSVDNLRRLVAAGGKVALGNDYGGGKDLEGFELGIPMFELEMMQKAGMTPMQIIQASTRNAAHVIDREADLGTISAGKLADILVVKGDPLQDLNSMKNVWIVMKEGQIIRE